MLSFSNLNIDNNIAIINLVKLTLKFLTKFKIYLALALLAKCNLTGSIN